MKVTKNIRIDIMSNKIKDPKYYAIYRYNFDAKIFEKIHWCDGLSSIIEGLKYYGANFPDEKVLYRLYPRKNKITSM